MWENLPVGKATVMSWLKESHEIENVHKNLRIVSFQDQQPVSLDQSVGLAQPPQVERRQEEVLIGSGA